MEELNNAQLRKLKALAQRIEDVRHDRNLQWAISDMARTEAYEYFALTRFHRDGTVDVVRDAGHTFILEKNGPAGAQKMADWLRSRPETPSCR